MPRSGASQGVPEWRVRASDTRCRADSPHDHVQVSPGSTWRRARARVYTQERPSRALPPLPRRRRSAATNWTTSPVWFHGVAHYGSVEKDPRLYQRADPRERKIFPHAGACHESEKETIIFLPSPRYIRWTSDTTSGIPSGNGDLYVLVAASRTPVTPLHGSPKRRLTG